MFVHEKTFATFGERGGTIHNDFSGTKRIESKHHSFVANFLSKELFLDYGEAMRGPQTGFFLVGNGVGCTVAGGRVVGGIVVAIFVSGLDCVGSTVDGCCVVGSTVDGCCVVGG